MPGPDTYGPTPEFNYDQLIAEALANANTEVPGSMPRGNTPLPKVSLEDYGIPPWLAQAYYQAQQDYDNELAAVQSTGLGLSDPIAQARLSQIRSRLTSIENQLDNYMPKPGTQDTWSAGSTASPYLMRQRPDGTLEQMPNPNYRAPTGPQLAPRYPDQAENALLANEKLRQSMMTQHELDVKAIGDMIARGEIDQAGADRMLGLSRANFEASLKGTTPFAMDTQRQNVAGDVMQRRMSTGNSMAQGLLSGASGIYGNILGGQNPPTNFNPLMMAQGFTDQMGGGPELNALAKAVLQGALQGGGL